MKGGPPNESQSGQQTYLQPLTFRGIALYAYNPFRRIFFAQFICALVTSLVVGWFLSRHYVPVVSQVVSQLPERAGLENGVLFGISDPIVAGQKFFSISIASDPNFDPGNTADIQARFSELSATLCSIPGCGSLSYNKNLLLNLSRSKVEPWWGAWKPLLVGGIMLVFFLGLYLTWRILSLLYAPGLKLFAFLMDRELSWSGSSRMASAALLPGALFLTVAIVFYSLQTTGLPGLTAAFAVHLVLPWIFLAGALFCLRKIGAKRKSSNPFKTS